jgi:hypothetical protein
LRPVVHRGPRAAARQRECLSHTGTPGTAGPIVHLLVGDPLTEPTAVRSQGPDAPRAPSTMLTVLLRRRPETAVTLYSPGRTGRLIARQPADEVLRSQDTRRTPGLPAESTTTCDPLPGGQSAELQIGPPGPVAVTATNFAPMLKRHGRLAAATARTVNRGLLPAWYQYCGDERRSVTAPGAQAAARPAARRCLAPRCRAGVGFGRAEGEGVGEA